MRFVLSVYSVPPHYPWFSVVILGFQWLLLVILSLQWLSWFLVVITQWLSWFPVPNTWFPVVIGYPGLSWFPVVILVSSGYPTRVILGFQWLSPPSSG